MNIIKWDQVTYKLKGALVAPGDLKYYYHKGIELEMWLNGQLIGHTETEN